MILLIGWKNVWRNRTRSLVVIIAVMLGIFGGVMATGIMQGWIEQRIHDCIYKEVAHVQIHNPEYMYNEEIQHTITDYEKLANILDTLPEVVAWSPRVKLFVMAKTSWTASGFVLKGVDPEKEMQVSELYQDLAEGDFLEGEHRRPSIVIGSKAAENLKLLNYEITSEKLDSIDKEVFSAGLVEKLKTLNKKRFRNEKDFRDELKKVLAKREMNEYGDKLVKYFSFYRMGTSIQVTMQNKSGEIMNLVFKVRGVYKTFNSVFDAMNAYVDRDILNRYTDLAGNEVHEVAVITADNETGVKVADKLSAYLPEQDIMSWRKSSPEMAMYTDFSAVMAYIYVAIILFALAFGIINTMMMSVLERIKELGMLMAIGMNRKRVFGMIMTESVFLTLTGAVAGMIFSGVMVELFRRTGINVEMWSEGMEALGYASVIYPSVSLGNYMGITILVIITGVVSAIWPARKALKLNPVEALRTE
ncbi:MAG: ABC transporter permease [Bacteroidales bacterium]|nr:ABC transporter permease [Bacteroidales bacterium]